MKRFLTAFTLAEVLITLAIIGVVARITLPALMSNVAKQQAATALVKAINTIELTNETVLADCGSQSLSGALTTSTTPITATQYLTNIAPHMKGELKKIDIATGASDASKGTLTLSTKDGIMIYAGTAKATLASNNITSFPEQYTGTYFEIVVDTNGPARPNKYAEDRFKLWIDESGAVIAPGSYTHACYTSNKFNDTTGTVKAGYLATDGCPNNSVCKKTDYAAGSIVDNAGKIAYKIK